MRVLFIEIDTESTWAIASIGPAFIAAYLRAHGHEVEFFRAPLDAGPQQLVDRIEAIQPDLLGFSLTTRQWQRARALVREVRTRIDVPVVAGGLHPTFAPEVVLAASSVAAHPQADTDSKARASRTRPPDMDGS